MNQTSRNTETADRSSFSRTWQLWTTVSRLSPIRPLHPVKLKDRKSLQVVDIPSIAARLRAEFHPPAKAKLEMKLCQKLKEKKESLKTSEFRTLERSTRDLQNFLHMQSFRRILKESLAFFFLKENNTKSNSDYLLKHFFRYIIMFFWYLGKNRSFVNNWMIQGGLPNAKSWTLVNRFWRSQKSLRSVRCFSLTRPVAKSTVCHKRGPYDTCHHKRQTRDNLNQT